MQLSGSAVRRVVTATVHDARGTVDEGAIAGVHAIVYPLLPEMTMTTVTIYRIFGVRT